MNRSRALSLYFSVLCVAIGLCAVLPVFQFVLSAVLSTLIAAVALRLLCCDKAEEAAPPAPAAATPIESPLLLADVLGRAARAVPRLPQLP